MANFSSLIFEINLVSFVVRLLLTMIFILLYLLIICEADEYDHER